MPKVVQVPGVGNVEFPDSMSDEAISAQLIKSVKHAEIPKPQNWSDKLGLVNPMGRTFVDTLEGAAAGLASTVYHGGDAIRRMTGSERIIDKPEVQQAMRPPDNAAGKIGKFGEQVAEVAIPAGRVAKALGAAPTLLRMAAQGGTAAGIAGLQTGADPGSMALAGGLGAAAEAIPAGAAGSAIPRMLKESAQKQYGQVINATKQGNKWLSQNKIVPELIDRGVKAFTLKGLLAKAEGQAKIFGEAIGDAWQALPEGSKIALDPIIEGMSTTANNALTIAAPGGKLIPVSTYAKTAMKQMDFLKDTLRGVAEVNPATGAMEVPVQKLRQLRQAWDEVAANAKVFQGQQLADHASGQIHAMASNSIREQLAAEFPDIAALNKEYSFWKNTEKVVRDTVLRREGQAKPMSQQIASAAGAAMGGASGGLHGAIAGKSVMEGLQQVMSSPAWKTVSAVYKDRLADAIVAGNRGAVANITARIVKSLGLESGVKMIEAPGQSSPAAPQAQVPQ